MTPEELKGFLARQEELQHESALEKWRREAREQEDRFARERAQRSQEAIRLEQLRVGQWDQWLRGHLNNGRAFMTESIGMALGQMRRQLRDEIAEQIGQWRAEITIANAHNAGQVIDLPALPLRRHLSDVA